MSKELAVYESLGCKGLHSWHYPYDLSCPRADLLASTTSLFSGMVPLAYEMGCSVCGKDLQAYEMVHSADEMGLRGPRGIVLRRAVLSVPQWLPPSPALLRTSDRSWLLHRAALRRSWGKALLLQALHRLASRNPGRLPVSPHLDHLRASRSSSRLRAWGGSGRRHASGDLDHPPALRN